MRRLLAGVLIVAAVGMLLMSYGALSNLWAGYQDSPTRTYISIGVPWLILSLAAIAVAIALLRKP